MPFNTNQYPKQSFHRHDQHYNKQVVDVIWVNGPQAMPSSPQPVTLDCLCIGNWQWKQKYNSNVMTFMINSFRVQALVVCMRCTAPIKHMDQHFPHSVFGWGIKLSIRFNKPVIAFEPKKTACFFVSFSNTLSVYSYHVAMFFLLQELAISGSINGWVLKCKPRLNGYHINGRLPAGYILIVFCGITSHLAHTLLWCTPHEIYSPLIV